MQSLKLTLAYLGSLLNGLAPPAKSLDACIAEIQRAMLDALPAAAGQADPSIASRIIAAEDLQTLWYLRADLMGALAGCQGEVQAAQTLREISSRFQGLLPGRLSTRPSPLAHC